MSDHRYLSPEMVCEIVPGMTVRRLQRHRDEGTGPAYSKIGNVIVYDLEDITALLASRRIGTRDQP